MLEGNSPFKEQLTRKAKAQRAIQNQCFNTHDSNFERPDETPTRNVQQKRIAKISQQDLKQVSETVKARIAQDLDYGSQKVQQRSQ
jgi:hypothetical protein